MGLLERMEKSAEENGLEGEGQAKKQAEQESVAKKIDPYEMVKKKIHTRVLDTLNKQANNSGFDKADMQQLLDRIVNDDEFDIPRPERRRIASEVYNDIM